MKIKELNEFEKLYGIYIPTNEHFDYYITTLEKSPQFKDIRDLIKKFCDFENDIRNLEFSNIGEYKKGFALKRFKEYVVQTKAHVDFQEYDYSKIEFYSKDNIKMSVGHTLLSLDFSKANFNALKLFDLDNEIGNTWEEVCTKFQIHSFLAESKSFRQLCYGNLNPKRSQKIQHIFALQMVEEVKKYVPEEDIVFISHDEVVVKIKEGKMDRESYELFPVELIGIENIRVDGFERTMPVKQTLYYFDKIKDTKIYLKHIYDLNEKSFVEIKERVFWGMPKNKFYKYFKEYIIHEPITEKDLYFWHEGQLAMWIK